MTVKGGIKCNKWPDFPIGVNAATGGLIENTVMICGGRVLGSISNKCYSLTSHKATLVTHMSVARSYTASIVLNDNTLWVTGGYTDDGYSTALSSTEKVTLNGIIPGPDLPMALRSHAMVAINTTASIVIGGLDGSYTASASTFYYDHIGGEWINGPSLIHARSYHAAGIVTDEVTDENYLSVTGGSNINLNAQDSTEILLDGKWVPGKICDTNSIKFTNSTKSSDYHRLDSFSNFRTVAFHTYMGSFNGQIRQKTSNTWRQL